MPELADISLHEEFSAHNYMDRKMKIRNFNEDKIAKLTESQLQTINAVFEKESKLLQDFGYDLTR